MLHVLDDMEAGRRCYFSFMQAGPIAASVFMMACVVHGASHISVGIAKSASFILGTSPKDYVG